MSKTKQQIIENAYDFIGLGGFVFELSPEEIFSAIKSLNSFIASLSQFNIVFSPAYPTTENLSDVTNIPDADELAIELNFAVLSSAKYGKTVSPSLLSQAAKYKRDLLAKYSSMSQVSLERAPLGAGFRPDDRGPNGPFVEKPVV